jgi:hypothetical protein
MWSAYQLYLGLSHLIKKAEAATYSGSGLGSSVPPIPGECPYLDLAPHVAHEDEGVHEAQDAP